MKRGYAFISMLLSCLICTMAAASLYGIEIPIKYTVLFGAILGVSSFILLILMCIAGDSSPAGRERILRAWFGGESMHHLITMIWVPTFFITFMADMYIITIASGIFAVFLEIVRKMNNNTFRSY